VAPLGLRNLARKNLGRTASEVSTMLAEFYHIAARVLIALVGAPQAIAVQTDSEDIVAFAQYVSLPAVKVLNEV
jgi:hypothetical protein